MRDPDHHHKTMESLAEFKFLCLQQAADINRPPDPDEGGGGHGIGGGGGGDEDDVVSAGEVKAELLDAWRAQIPSLHGDEIAEEAIEAVAATHERIYIDFKLQHLPEQAKIYATYFAELSYILIELKRANDALYGGFLGLPETMHTNSVLHNVEQSEAEVTFSSYEPDICYVNMDIWCSVIMICFQAIWDLGLQENSEKMQELFTKLTRQFTAYNRSIRPVTFAYENHHLLSIKAYQPFMGPSTVNSLQAHLDEIASMQQDLVHDDLGKSSQEFPEDLLDDGELLGEIEFRSFIIPFPLPVGVDDSCYYFSANPFDTIYFATALDSWSLRRSSGVSATGSLWLHKLSQDSNFCRSLAMLISTEALVEWNSGASDSIAKLLPENGDKQRLLIEASSRIMRHGVAYILTGVKASMQLNPQLKDCSWEAVDSTQLDRTPTALPFFILEDFVSGVYELPEIQKLSLRWLYESKLREGGGSDTDYLVLKDMFYLFYLPKLYSEVLVAKYPSSSAPELRTFIAWLEKLVLSGCKHEGEEIDVAAMEADAADTFVVQIMNSSYFTSKAEQLKRWGQFVMNGVDERRDVSHRHGLTIKELPPGVVYDLHLYALLQSIANVSAFFNDSTQTADFYRFDSVLGMFLRLVNEKPMLFSKGINLQASERRHSATAQSLILARKLLARVVEDDAISLWVGPLEQANIRDIMARLSRKARAEINRKTRHALAAWLANHKSVFWYAFFLSMLGTDMWVNNYVLPHYLPVIDFVVFGSLIVLMPLRLVPVTRRYWHAYKLDKFLQRKLRGQLGPFRNRFTMASPISVDTVVASGVFFFLGIATGVIALTLVPKDFHPEMNMQIMLSIVGGFIAMISGYLWLKHTQQRCTGRYCWDKQPVRKKTSMVRLLVEGGVCTAGLAAIAVANIVVPKSSYAVGRFDLYGFLMVCSMLDVGLASLQFIFRVSLLCCYGRRSRLPEQRPQHIALVAAEL